MQNYMRYTIYIIQSSAYVVYANTNFNHIFFEISYLAFLKQVQLREIIVKLWKETLSL